MGAAQVLNLLSVQTCHSFLYVWIGACWCVGCVVDPQEEPRVGTALSGPDRGAASNKGDEAYSGREVMSAFVQGVVFVVATPVGIENPGRFMLDTGSAFSSVDERLAETLEQRGSSRVQATPAGAKYLEHLEIDVSGHEFAPARVFVVNLEQFSNYYGFGIDGVIGVDFMLEFAVHINYEEQRVAVEPAGGFSWNGAGELIPVVTGGYVYTIATVKAPGGEMYGANAVIDTGYNGTVALSVRFAEELGITATHSGSILNLDGEASADMAAVGAFRIAAFEFIECPVDVFDARMPARVDTLIGAQLLSRFHVILDLARSRVIVRPGKDLHEQFESDTLSVGIVTMGPPYDRFVVRWLAPELSEHGIGLRVGDEILRVGDTDAALLGISKINESFLEAAKDGRVLQVKVSRGGAVLDLAVTLAD